MDFARKDLEQSRKGWATFHQKDNPREELEVKIQWPKRWECAGFCVTMYYASDKWYPDGETVNYYHDHGDSIRVYHPVGVVRGGDFRDFKSTASPVKTYPTAAFVLGECLGWDLREKKGASEIYRALPPKDAILCAFPNRKVLFAFSKREGVVALFVGRGMSVKDVGIVG